MADTRGMTNTTQQRIDTAKAIAAFPDDQLNDLIQVGHPAMDRLLDAVLGVQEEDQEPERWDGLG